MKVLNMVEASKILGITPREASLLFYSGKLRGWRIPGTGALRTSDQNVDRYLSERTAPTAVPTTPQNH